MHSKQLSHQSILQVNSVCLYRRNRIFSFSVGLHIDMHCNTSIFARGLQFPQKRMSSSNDDRHTFAPSTVVGEEKKPESLFNWRNWLKRESLLQVINLLLVFASALVIWKGAIAISLSESPVVVVLSGSMEPGMRRGDLLVLSNRTKQLHCGDIVVYKVQNREIPIVHRIIEVHDDGNEPLYLTKGDNNFFDDRSLYSPHTFFLRRSDIVGKSVFIVRAVGYVTIIMKEHPLLKFLVVGLLSLTVLLGE